MGNLNTKRESAAAVALPNELTLIVGGQTCAPMTYGGTAGFQCNALQTAELYNETSKTFSLAGSGSGGLMTIARSGPSATLISGSGTGLDGQVLIVGGSTGSSFLSLAPPPAGSGAPTGQVGLNSAELYNPATDAFTATNSIPGCRDGVTICATGLPSICVGPTSPITSASESGTTVTITSASNPTGLIVGDKRDNRECKRRGLQRTLHRDRDSERYHVPVHDRSGIGRRFRRHGGRRHLCVRSGGSGICFDPERRRQGAAGGRRPGRFPGSSRRICRSSSTQSTQTFARTSGSLTTQRELFPLVAMDPAVVTGPLSGHLVAFGGIDANSDACTTATSNVVATTLNTAEVFDPGTQTWSAAANTMGVKRAGVATMLEAGSLAGEAILPGGVDVEVGTLPSTCAGTANIKQAAQSETDLYDPATGVGGTFSATGSLNQAREGAGQGVIGAGTDVTDVLVIGGACTTPTPSLQSVVIGSAQATTTCGTANATNDYSELYSQGGKTWTVGPAAAGGFSPSNGAASAVLP